MIAGEMIFFVEDNDDDVELAVRAFKQAKVTNPLIRAKDGVDALDFLFARGNTRTGMCVTCLS